MDGDAADTAKNVVGVLDGKGNVRQCRASGHWIHFPKIAGIENKVRQRYPIAPLHVSKDYAVQQVFALKHTLQSYSKLLEGNFINLGAPSLGSLTFSHSS